LHITGFVDREGELEALSRAYEARPGLLVVYGRRRIGKTRLLLEWCGRSGVRCCYYHAVPAKHEVNLRGLAEAVELGLELKGFSKPVYGSLDSLLEAMSYRSREAVVIIDEFTYWVRAEPRAAGELQRFVDHVLPETRLLLVVVGSLLGVMFRDVLGGGSPLYGRARFRLRLGELEPWHLPEFYPWLSREDLVRMYALFGGIPYYHAVVEEGWGPREALWELLLSPTARLRDEALFTLREEFREPSTYYSILRAIASGASTPSRISDATGIHRQHVSKYLSVMENLGIVSRETPLFSKKGRYVISDKFLAAWFEVAEPLLSVTGPREIMVEEALRRLEARTSRVFEEVACRYVEWLASQGKISYTEIGRFQHKGVEIDLVAIDHRRRIMHLFEAKWSDLTSGEAARISRALEVKALNIPLHDYTVKTHIVARSMRGEKPGGIMVHTLQDMPFKTHGSKPQAIILHSPEH